MADFLSLISAIPSLISDFSGSSNPYGKQQKQLADRQAQYSAALADTNNPLYQQLYGQYQQQNRNNLAQTIAEAQGQNRMNAAMGRVPLFSPERGGETIFRNLMKGYQDSGVQSDQQTRQALMQAAQTGGAAIGGYNSITPAKNSATAQKLAGVDLLSQILGNATKKSTNTSSMQQMTPMSANANPYAGLIPNYNTSQFLAPGQQQVYGTTYNNGWGGY